MGINLPGLIAQIINFSLLMTVLYFVLYKPVTKMLDQRSLKIKESLEQAARLKADTAKAEEQLKAQIELARQEGRGIVAQAQQVSDRIRDEAKGQAKTEADAIILRARAEIAAERDAAVEELRRQFADLTIAAASKVVNASLDKAQHKRLIDEVLAQSGNIGKN